MHALAWLLVARVALRLLSYNTVRRLVQHVPSTRRRRGLMTPVECEAALRRAATVVPGATCLARAVAAAYLLRRSRHASVLTIGVGFAQPAPSRRDFQAHAWLESEGTVVVGAQERAGYEPLLRDAIAADSGK
jgi:hypothetical protein